MMGYGRFLFAVLISAWALVPNLAKASLVDAVFAGNILDNTSGSYALAGNWNLSAPPPELPSIPIGMPGRAVVTYDSAATPTQCFQGGSSNTCAFLPSTMDAVIDVGPFRFTAIDGVIDVFDDDGNIGVQQDDGVLIHFQNNPNDQNIFGPQVDGLTLRFIQIALYDQWRALGMGDITTLPTDFAARFPYDTFSFTYVGLTFEDEQGNDFAVYFDVAGSSEPVPLPPMAVLMLAALSRCLMARSRIGHPGHRV